MLGRARLVICGAGSLGSQLTENLVRHLSVMDFDRVEGHNIGTQVYDEGDIGALKAEALRARCFRAAGVELEAVTKRLEAQNVTKLLRETDLVVDAFDNAGARRLVAEHCPARGLPRLHLGVNADDGEVRWNVEYRVPNDVPLGNACDYPLARNLVLFVVALGSEAIARFLLEGACEAYSFTLRDLAVSREE